MSALLAADGLELAYGELAVCRNISIEINAGEIVALTLVVLFMPGGLVQAWRLIRAKLTGAPAYAR